LFPTSATHLHSWSVQLFERSLRRPRLGVWSSKWLWRLFRRNRLCQRNMFIKWVLLWKWKMYPSDLEVWFRERLWRPVRWRRFLPWKDLCLLSVYLSRKWTLHPSVLGLRWRQRLLRSGRWTKLSSNSLGIKPIPMFELQAVHPWMYSVYQLNLKSSHTDIKWTLDVCTRSDIWFSLKTNLKGSANSWAIMLSPVITWLLIKPSHFMSIDTELWTEKGKWRTHVWWPSGKVYQNKAVMYGLLHHSIRTDMLHQIRGQRALQK